MSNVPACARCCGTWISSSWRGRSCGRTCCSCRAARRGRPERGMEETLGLVVEVLSPRSKRIDCALKPPLYRDFEVPEYWVVDSGLKPDGVRRRAAPDCTLARCRDGIVRFAAICAHDCTLAQRPRRRVSDLAAIAHPIGQSLRNTSTSVRCAAPFARSTCDRGPGADDLITYIRYALPDDSLAGERWRDDLRSRSFACGTRTARARRSRCRSRPTSSVRRTTRPG